MRAFVGIPLDGPEAEALLDVQGRIAVGREVPAANLHLTLAFLDDQPVEMLEALHEELELIRHSQFELHLKGMDIFGAPRSRSFGLLAAPDPVLMALQADVAQAARRLGIGLEKRRFRPHVTLSRFRDGKQPPERVQAALSRGASLEIDPIPVSEIALYRSSLTSDGAVYEILSSYPLLVQGLS